MINGKKIFKVTNGIREELTSAEYEQTKADLLIIEEEKTIKENTDNIKASGKQKLKDLGLNDEEINALLGV